MKVLILGTTGMLGNAMFRFMSLNKDLKVYGTVRDNSARRHFDDALSDQLIPGIDVENYDSVVEAFSIVKPDVVVNCIGLVKQLINGNDTIRTLSLNALLPHRLAVLCETTDARLVHISTDCVFSGKKGNYQETDFPDAYDLYGRSKLLGEVDYPHAITLRTSIIGHELSGQRSLIGWFLAQEKSVKGFTHAIFSGLPTVELANVVVNFVLPRPEMKGLYHVASQPIDKYNLLSLVAKTYGKNIDIIPSDELVIDRSLDAKRFHQATGYDTPTWPQLIKTMHEFQ